MEFKDVQEFFQSWGMYPVSEDTYPYNKEVIDNGINEPCFDRMLEQAAAKYGEEFALFCSRAIDATDNAFYLQADTWKELKDAWDKRPSGEKS